MTEDKNSCAHAYQSFRTMDLSYSDDSYPGSDVSYPLSISSYPTLWSIRTQQIMTQNI